MPSDGPRDLLGHGSRDLPPLGARAAAVLTVWAVVFTALHLAVRELGLRLVP